MVLEKQVLSLVSGKSLQRNIVQSRKTTVFYVLGQRGEHGS